MRLTGARVPALDGLRAVAVLMVMATHFDLGQATLAGVMGVTVFFTLSGFLITSLLLEERTRTGRVDRWAFYGRRARRLFPALAVMLAVVCVLTVDGFPTDVTGGMVAAAVGYVSNWYLAATTVHGQIQWGALGHTWSLAIEEQFYIVWPLVVAGVSRWGRRGVLVTAAVGAGASVSWGLVSGASSLHTEVSAYGLLVGCALAAWLHGSDVWPPSWVPVVALAPMLVFVAVGVDARQVAYVTVPLLTACAIAAVVSGGVRWLEVGPLLWIGRRSYGLYLWHVPVAYLCFQLAGVPWVVFAPVGVALSFALAAASWRWIEEPILNSSRPRSGSPSVRERVAARS